MQFQPMLNDAERAICRQMGHNSVDFLASKHGQSNSYRAARLAVCVSRASGWRPVALSETELAACRSMGNRPEDFLRSKFSRLGIVACASESDPIIPSRQSLIDAHNEVDRALAADADAEWRDTPIPKLISRALDGLGALDTSTKSSWIDSYNDFLTGVMNAMRALQLASPDPEADKLHAPSSLALIRAHDDIDRAHGAALTQDVDGQWQKVPMPELIGAAASGLKAYKPGDDSTYDDLLMGTLNAMRALELAVPAYIDRKPLPGEK